MAAYFHASAAVLSALVAMLVVVGRTDRQVNLLLACFLGVVAGAEGAWALQHLARDPGLKLTWFRVGAGFASLIPGLLYWFGSRFPEPNRLNTRGRVGLAIAASAALAATSPWLQPMGAGDPFSTVIAIATALFTGVVFTVVIVQVARPLLRGEEARPHAMAFPAFCVATVEAWRTLAASFTTGLPDLVSTASLGVQPATVVNLQLVAGPATALLLLVSLLAILLVRDSSPDVRRVLWAGFGVAAGVELLSSTGSLLQFAQNAGWYPGVVPGWLPGTSLAAGLTWLIFALLLSGALLRYRVLDVSIRKRRWGARVLAVFILIDAAVLLFRGFTGSDWSAPGGIAPATLVLGLLVFVFSDRFYTAADAMGEALYGVPAGTDRDEQVALYRHGVRQAVEEGQSGLDPRLESLRKELEIDPEVARSVERSVVASEDRPVAIGETLAGRYRVEELLGRGGAGRTFRARDELLDRDVVLKEVLHGDPSEARRVLDEARTAGQLQHPNIVTVFDVLRRPHSSIIVMEHVSGGSLKTCVEDAGALSAREAIFLGERILEGLQEIHEAGIVHRDLKPGNILIDGEGEPKITDFGLARGNRTRSFDEAPGGEGTPGYMAPEQRQGREVTPASDLYAVGRILDEVTQDPLPAPLFGVVEPALREDPARRWGSAEAMRDALGQATPRTVSEEQQRSSHTD